MADESILQTLLNIGGILGYVFGAVVAVWNFISNKRRKKVHISAKRRRLQQEILLPYVDLSGRQDPPIFHSIDIVEVVVTNETDQHKRVTKVLHGGPTFSNVALDFGSQGIELVKSVPSVFQIPDPEKETKVVTVIGTLGDQWKVDVSDVVHLD